MWTSYSHFQEFIRCNLHIVSFQYLWNWLMKTLKEMKQSIEARPQLGRRTITVRRRGMQNSVQAWPPTGVTRRVWPARRRLAASCERNSVCLSLVNKIKQILWESIRTPQSFINAQVPFILRLRYSTKMEYGYVNQLLKFSRYWVAFINMGRSTWLLLKSIYMWKMKEKWRKLFGACWKLTFLPCNVMRENSCTFNQI